MSFGSLAFTPVVQMLQERHGSRRQYDRLEERLQALELENAALRKKARRGSASSV